MFALGSALAGLSGALILPNTSANVGIDLAVIVEAFVVVDAGMTPLQRGQLLSDEAYLEAIEQYGDEFDARMGAEAIRDLLAAMHESMLGCEADGAALVRYGETVVLVTAVVEIE